MGRTQKEGVLIGETITQKNRKYKSYKYYNSIIYGEKMGHDIYASIVEIKKLEIAYLRKNAGDPDNGTIYKLLNAEDCNGGVSGNGGHKIFTKEEIEYAIEKGKDTIVLKDNIAFLKKCIKGLKEDQMIYISFC